MDTVGNGFAAEILASMFRGDLRGAARHAVGPVPDDPAFSMTAAAAIGQVGVLTLDPALLQVAVGWARRGTIPILRFLPTLLDCCVALLKPDVDGAADLAERYWEEAAVVPVSRVEPLPLLTGALLSAGRTAAARAGDPQLVTKHARELLDLATTSCFRLQVIDALELLAAVAVPQDGPESRSQLLKANMQSSCEPKTSACFATFIASLPRCAKSPSELTGSTRRGTGTSRASVLHEHRTPPAWAGAALTCYA